ncbi:hypothetical protein CPB86DRAFT_788666 [Serendipita vermifera]|nr:hypothetical protein CPB86DRAFT_788666 [Serendipita vermifera]
MPPTSTLQNGSLCLPVELLERILVSILPRYPVEPPIPTCDCLQPILLLDLDDAFSKACILREAQALQLQRVCHLWESIIEAHRFTVCQPSSERLDEFDQFLTKYPNRKNLIRRLSLQEAIPEQFRKVLCHFQHGMTNIPPTPYSAIVTSQLRQLILNIRDDSGDYNMDLGELAPVISQINGLESLALKIRYVHKQPQGDGVWYMPNLRTLEIYIHPHFPYLRALPRRQVPFYEIFRTTLILEGLQNLRLRNLPWTEFHQPLVGTFRLFCRSLLHAQIEVDWVLETRFWKVVHAPHLEHLELHFPEIDCIVRQISTETPITTLTINEINRLWEWYITEDGKKRPSRSESSLEDAIRAIYDHYYPAESQLVPCLSTIILAHFYMHAEAPVRESSFWASLEQVIVSWDDKFQEKGVTLLARSGPFDESLPVQAYFKKYFGIYTESM